MTKQTFSFLPSSGTAQPVVPTSGTALWVAAIVAGGMTVSDLQTGETVAQSPGLISLSSRRVLTRNTASDGTTLRIRFLYDSGDTIDSGSFAPVVIRVFGSSDSGEAWTTVRNLNGDASVPIPINPGTDTKYATPGGGSAGLKISQPDNNAHAWDCDAFERFVIAIERRYIPAVGSGSGTPANAYLEAKIV